jgi:hypothetical protein
MQPQTTIAIIAATKIPSCTCCIVVFSVAMTPPRAHYMTVRASSLSQKVGQLGDVGCDPSRLILAQQLRRRSSPRLILEIDIRERLLVVVAHGEADGLFLNRTGPRPAQAIATTTGGSGFSTSLLLTATVTIARPPLAAS